MTVSDECMYIQASSTTALSIVHAPQPLLRLSTSFKRIAPPIRILFFSSNTLSTPPNIRIICQPNPSIHPIEHTLLQFGRTYLPVALLNSAADGILAPAAPYASSPRLSTPSGSPLPTSPRSRPDPAPEVFSSLASGLVSGCLPDDAKPPEDVARESSEIWVH